MDEVTDGILTRYLQDVRVLTNEAAKTHRFAALISELFPGTSAPIQFAMGVEKLVRIDTAQGTKRGRIDAYHGNAVIEFENSLRVTEEVAKQQLREYTSGIWARERTKRRPLICIASDGITWKVFLPRYLPATPGRVRPEDITLEHLRTIIVSSDTLHDFWLWLTSVLFRPARIDPTADRFRTDFGATSPAFADAMEALQKAWASIERISEAHTAFDTWKRYLTVTYGRLGATPTRTTSEVNSDLEALFLKHTYLACIARFLAWAAFSHGRISTHLHDLVQDILSGRFFEMEGIQNLVDNDFFQWVRRSETGHLLAPVWERILEQMLTYDLGRLNQDVLKGVYQELVDPKDRHDLGEYYTPEWLCERIVAELLPVQRLVSVLDPTCGSGSFLRAVIAHLLRISTQADDETRLHTVLNSVVGIDIHPLAVTIARATYLLAIRDLVKTARRPIQIPVYLADSLFLPNEVQQLTIDEVPTYEIHFGGDRRVSIPEDLIHTPDLFDSAIAACTDVATEHASTGKESATTLRAYLRRTLPALTAQEHFEVIAAALWDFTAELSDLIKKRRNSIWSFIVRNGYRPAMLRDRFDYIIGNPPWLSYRYIADPEYQAEVKRRAVDDYGIAPSAQRLVTQMELATVFFVHTLSVFGRFGARLGFVMPRSILSADQHSNLRNGLYRASVRLDQYWDLLEVAPVFKVPSCVLFATKADHTPATASYSLPAVE